MLIYVQGELVDIWKENILEYLKVGEIEFVIEGEFLTELKKEFGGEDNKLAKMTELKRVEWDLRTMEEFIHEF